jgi:hypothetical protein
MPPATPGTPMPPTPEHKSGHHFGSGTKWDALRARATIIASIGALFLFLAAAGGAIGYFYSQSKKTVTVTKSPNIETLSPSEINQLGSIGTNLGTTNQILNIGANTLFRGAASIVGGLTVGGSLNANGPVTLSQLNITGATAGTSMNLGSNLNVGGTSTLQKALTVNALTTINNGLTVSGQISAGSITAKSIAVNSISLTGPLTIGHIVTSGPTPFYASGADGSGGTVSISGNDTSGTININAGSGPSANSVLMSVTFRAAFGAAPHIQLTAKTLGAAEAEAYVLPTSTGFQVLANTPPSGRPMSFDYLVTQ